MNAPRSKSHRSLLILTHGYGGGERVLSGSAQGITRNRRNVDNGIVCLANTA